MEEAAVTKQPRQKLKGSLALYLFLTLILAFALWYGKTRSGPDLWPHIVEIYPGASSYRLSDGVYSVLGGEGELLGWAATGDSRGYGGPLLVVVGIDTTGNVKGTSIVEHKETPLFFRMVRAPNFFTSFTGGSFQSINYDYGDVVGVTGATRSSDAIVDGVRSAVSRVAGEKFGVYYPVPEPPFEFGLFEIIILGLFAAGITAVYLKGPYREILRWVTQVSGLMVIGFWKNSPITVAKITGLLSGYFPNIHSNLSLYLLVAGFAITILLLGRSVYCTHICPFGAAQQLINLVSGKNIRLPSGSARLLTRLRNVIVFGAITAALVAAQPALSSYEPFAALFALRGTILQWLLLLVVLLFSLIVSRPWCNFFCPMRSCERVLQDIRRRSLSLMEPENE